MGALEIALDDAKQRRRHSNVVGAIKKSLY